MQGGGRRAHLHRQLAPEAVERGLELARGAAAGAAAEHATREARQALLSMGIKERPGAERDDEVDHRQRPRGLMEDARHALTAADSVACGSTVTTVREAAPSHLRAAVRTCPRVTRRYASSFANAPRGSPSTVS